jgi:hypothetical protein
VDVRWRDLHFPEPWFWGAEWKNDEELLSNGTSLSSSSSSSSTSLNSGGVTTATTPTTAAANPATTDPSVSVIATTQTPTLSFIQSPAAESDSQQFSSTIIAALKTAGIEPGVPWGKDLPARYGSFSCENQISTLKRKIRERQFEDLLFNWPRSGH